MFSIKSVYITVQHKSHRQYREYELSSKFRAALRRVITYQIQISEEIHADIAIPTELQMYTIRGAKQGGVGGVSTPPEFWMGGLNTCQPPLILRKKVLGGGGLAPLKLI